MSAFSIFSVPVLAQHNLPNAHALAQAQTKQRSETSLSSPLSCMAYALAITMDATQPTAPSESSELTLTRVMSPNDHSCPICTQSMGNEIWVCCRCYAYGHPGCIQITVVEGYTFCQQCAAWAKNEVERVKQQQQIVAWKETMQYQLEGTVDQKVLCEETESRLQHRHPVVMQD